MANGLTIDKALMKRAQTKIAQFSDEQKQLFQEKFNQSTDEQKLQVIQRLAGQEQPIQGRVGQPFLPGTQKVEQLQAQRQDVLVPALQRFGQEFRGGIGQPGGGVKPLTALSVVGGLARRGESALASAGEELQRGRGFGEAGRAFGRGLTGKQFSEFGDIVRKTGFGGILNEAISAFAGLGTSIGLTNLATKGKIVEGIKKGQKSIQGIQNSIKFKRDFSFKIQADKLTGAVDDVVDGVRGEFDDLYGKIGDNVLQQADEAIAQDIVSRIPKNIINNVQKLAKAKGKILDPTVNTAKVLKTEIGKNIPKKVWSGVQDATELQGQLIQDYFSLNKIIANNAGELKQPLLQLNSKFANLMRFNKVIKGITKEAVTGVTKTSIRNLRKPEFQGKLFEIKEFSNRFAPQVDNILKSVDSLNRSIALKRFGGRVALGGAAFGLGDVLLRRPIVRAIEESGGGGFSGGGGGFE